MFLNEPQTLDEFIGNYKNANPGFASVFGAKKHGNVLVLPDCDRDKRGLLVGWIVFAGYDGRGYAVFLQRATNNREPMVRVGCRFFTLATARKHWASARRTGPRARSGAQILMLIGVALDIAHSHRLFHRRSNKTGRTLDNFRPKFDTRPNASKAKRK